MKGASPERAMPGETLDSWKAIAAYLHRDVRTVMRWEHVRGLPAHRVPGGGKPGVYALKSELDGWWRRIGPHLVEEAEEAARPGTPSVAVLPFANLSADKENEYFSDGLADEIITLLTRIPNLRVTARTSSFAFRDKLQDVREIGARLGVNALLEGSVQRIGERVRVSAQLVGARDGFHLWSESYDREIGDVFAVQDEIALAIACALDVRLEASHAVRSTPNLEAYNLWLKSRYYQHYESLEAVAKCRLCLDRAIALDPLFPPAYVGLAEVCRYAPIAGLVRPREAITQGRAAVRKALDPDNSLGEAHALSGAFRAWEDFDWTGAAADFDRAVSLAPASSQVHTLRTVYYLVPTGRLCEAEAEMERAVESDPVSPLAIIELGKVLLWSRQFDRAQAKLETAFDLRPDYPLAVWYRGVGLYFQGRIEEALTNWHSAMRKVGANPGMIGAIGMALGYLGRHAEARGALDELEAAERQHYASRFARAQIHLGLGETGAAFEWLERAVGERDPHILDLPCKPVWDGIRNDPRFAALLRKMRLA
jgi:TolB-like protein/Tfp pilus assembly protein PilF